MPPPPRQLLKPYYEDAMTTLYLADNRVVMPLLEPESVTLLFTDPPYGHNNQDGDLQSARRGTKGAKQAAMEPIANDSQENMREVMNSALSLAVQIMKSDCCCCCCCCCCGGGGPKPTFAW